MEKTIRGAAGKKKTRLCSTFFWCADCTKAHKIGIKAVTTFNHLVGRAKTKSRITAEEVDGRASGIGGTGAAADLTDA